MKKEEVGMVYPGNDLVFKRIFGDKRCSNVLRSFLKSALELDDNDLSKIEIIESSSRINKAENKEEIDKRTVLDIKCTTNTGKIIGIELQVVNDPGMRERTIYTNARSLAEQLFSGEEYLDLKKVITIVISVEHIIIKESQDYKFKFNHYDQEHKIKLSDLSEIHILEAKKLPKDKNNNLIDMLKFIKSKSMEEMEMLANKNPAIAEAVCVYKELTADQAFREEAWRRHLAICDRNSQINGARREGKAEGKAEGRAEMATEKSIEIAKNLLKKCIDVDIISETTGLTIQQIEIFQNS